MCRLPARLPGVEIQHTAPEPGGNRGAHCKGSDTVFFFLQKKINKYSTKRLFLNRLDYRSTLPERRGEISRVAPLLVDQATMTE